MNRNLKWVLILLPIGAAAYLLLKGKVKIFGKKGDADSGTGTSTTTNGVPDVQKEFPLKKGSKGAKVKELQQALMTIDSNLKGGADGVFGAGTEAAVIKALKKNTVDSQDDIVKILAKAKSADIAKVRANAANALKKTWDKNPKLRFYAVNDTKVFYGIVDAQGSHRKGGEITVKKGVALSVVPKKVYLDNLSNLYLESESKKYNLINPLAFYLN